MADLPPGSLFAGFVVDDLLGRGGMGEVYRATRVADGETVALKLLPAALAGEERYRRRFERESRLAASLSHPHLVPVLDAGEDDGALWMAMTLVEGPDLSSVLAERSTLHPGHAALITAQVAAALDAAAAEGLVHRDVKPGNIFLTTRDQAPHAYLGDFGLSRASDSQSGLTATGIFLGTIAYAAPEQIQAEQVGPATDVYALGAVLYRMLSGGLPFPRDRDVAVAMAHITEPAPRPSAAAPGCPPGLDDVVARAMAKDPLERYDSAGSLGDAAIAAAIDAGEPPPWPDRPTRPAPGAGDADAPTAI